jgi:hypothetical protein
MHRRASITPSGKKDGDHAGSNDRMNRRRITQVDPNVQIAEIVSIPTRTHARKKLNRNELYHFECEGEINMSSTNDKLHVKWDAKFDKPIEQLIYPSLQRFDNEAFEKKRQRYRSLHGGNNEFIAHVPRNIGEPGHVPDHFNEGLQLDFIKGGDIVHDNILFLYPPKWNVQVQRLQSATEEEQITENVIQSPIKSVAESGSGSVSEIHSRRSGRSFRSRMTYQEELEDEDTSISYVPLSSLKNYSSFEDEINAEGEKFLRMRLKENFKKKLEMDGRMLQEQADQNNPFNVAILKAKAHAPTNLPPLQDNGDKLVSWQ